MKKLLITLLIFLCFHPGSPKDIKPIKALAINIGIAEAERDNTRIRTYSEADPVDDSVLDSDADPDPVLKLEQIYKRVDSAQNLLNEKGR